MSSLSQPEHGSAADALAQIARLREQVETLIREKEGPAVDDLMDDLTDRLDTAANEASAAMREKAGALADQIKAQPLAAIAIAAAVGFLLGRAFR